MAEVDPETKEMLDDSPDNPDDSQRGGKVWGDPALKDATETGGTTGVSSEKTGSDEPTSGVLPGEKPVRE